MSSSVNRVLLLGNLGTDPEMYYTAGGHARTRMRLATDRPTRNGTESEADWHTVVCWERLAEFANEYLARGRLVFVAGRLTYRSVDGKDGQKRCVAEIVATEIVPLDRRPESAYPQSDDNADPTGSAAPSAPGGPAAPGTASTPRSAS